MSLGVPSYSPNAPGIGKVAEPELAQISTRLTLIVDRNKMHLDKLSRAIDRAVGAPPPTSEGAKQQPPRAVPNGVLGAISQQCEDLEAIGAQAGHLLDRLESIV